MVQFPINPITPEAPEVAGKATEKLGAPAPPKQRPTKILPTERIAFSKQLDLLRAYAVVSTPAMKPVALKDVASLAKMDESTISLAHSFFSDIGLLTKGEGGKYLPSQAVLDYARAFEWNPQTAAFKLAPVFRDTWFGQLLLPRLQYAKVMPEKEAIEILAGGAGASPDYVRNITRLLDYLESAGLVKHEGGNITIEQVPAVNGASAIPSTDSVVRNVSEDGGSSTKGQGSQPAIATAFSQVPEGKVQFHVSVLVDMGEFSTWKPERISAFFGGIAQVLAAKANVERDGSRG